MAKRREEGRGKEASHLSELRTLAYLYYNRGFFEKAEEIMQLIDSMERRLDTTSRSRDIDQEAA